MIVDTFTIQVPDDRKWREMFAAFEDDVTKEMMEIVRDTARNTLDYLKRTTPRGKGAPRFGRHLGSMWFTKELGKGSHRGRYLGFSVVIDHPFNTPNLVMVEVNPVPGNRVGRHILVNDGKRSILTDLEYGTQTHDVAVNANPSYEKFGPQKKVHSLHFRIGGMDIFRARARPKGITKTVGFGRRAASVGGAIFSIAARTLVDRLAAKYSSKP